MKEPKTCVYVIQATKPCNELEISPPNKVEKLDDRFRQYAAMWLSRFPSFSDRIEGRIERIGRRMIDYFELHKGKGGVCGKENPNDDAGELGRFDRFDACKGANQLTKAYAKWATQFLLNPKRDRDYATRISEKMENIRLKIRSKLSCDG